MYETLQEALQNALIGSPHSLKDIFPGFSVLAVFSGFKGIMEESPYKKTAFVYIEVLCSD